MWVEGRSTNTLCTCRPVVVPVHTTHRHTNRRRLAFTRSSVVTLSLLLPPSLLPPPGVLWVCRSVLPDSRRWCLVNKGRFVSALCHDLPVSGLCCTAAPWFSSPTNTRYTCSDTAGVVVLLSTRRLWLVNHTLAPFIKPIKPISHLYKK